MTLVRFLLDVSIVLPWSDFQAEKLEDYNIFDMKFSHHHIRKTAILLVAGVWNGLLELLIQACQILRLCGCCCVVTKRSLMVQPLARRESGWKCRSISLPVAFHGTFSRVERKIDTSSTARCEMVNCKGVSMQQTVSFTTTQNESAAVWVESHTCG